MQQIPQVPTSSVQFSLRFEVKMLTGGYLEMPDGSVVSSFPPKISTGNLVWLFEDEDLSLDGLKAIGYYTLSCGSEIKSSSEESVDSLV